jgi:hypothetical protein
MSNYSFEEIHADAQILTKDELATKYGSEFLAVNYYGSFRLTSELFFGKSGPLYYTVSKDSL